MTTEQTKEAQYILELKQTLRRIKKKNYPTCEDKDFVWGCYGCQANRFIRDFGAYLDSLETLYTWTYKKV